MTNKKSFLLYTDRLDILDELSDDDAGKLFKSIVEYVKTGSEPPRGTLTSVAFRGVKNGIDVATENYERLCLKNRENGKKGGRPKGSEKTQKPSGFEKNPTVISDNPEKPSGYFGFENKTQKTLTDTDTDIDEEEDYKRARAREDGIVDEIEGCIDRLRQDQDLGDSVATAIVKLAGSNSNFVINRAEIPREQFLRRLLELLQAVERNDAPCDKMALSVIEVLNGYEDGSIANPFAYLAAVLYNMAVLV